MYANKQRNKQVKAKIKLKINYEYCKIWRQDSEYLSLFIEKTATANVGMPCIAKHHLWRKSIGLHCQTNRLH